MTKPTLASNAWIIWAGDSRLDPSGDVGPGTTGTVRYHLEQICPFIAAPVAASNVYNFAHDGFQTTDILTQFSNSELSANTGYPVYYFIWIGINDLPYRTPAATYANLQSIWAQARGLGFHVVAFTSGPIAGSDVKDLDKLILSDQTLYDNLIRPELILPIMPELDTGHVWFVDTPHPSSAGNLRIAQAIAAAIDP